MIQKWNERMALASAFSPFRSRSQSLARCFFLLLVLSLFAFIPAIATAHHNSSHTKILTYYYFDVKKMTRWSKWVNMMAKAEMWKKENHAQNETKPTKMKRKLMENKKNCNRRWGGGVHAILSSDATGLFYLLAVFLPILPSLTLSYSSFVLSPPLLSLPLSLCNSPFLPCSNTFNILLNSIRTVCWQKYGEECWDR